MRVVEDLPCGIREIENQWIPLRDGTRLAARIWLPEDAEEHPVPAIVEYIPYRKRDFTTLRDEPMHRYFAGHGYAAVRVDMRGSGDSDGVLLDEYLQQELDDGCEVIAWLAGQPWCSGNVGMMGNSWGGFNALQVAALRPQALKAIITSCSTDDRYADDMHYIGGCLLNDSFDWGTTFFALLPRAPDPRVVGAKWRDMWLERLEKLEEPNGKWLRHQRRDAYWRHGSVCEDYKAIICPVFAVGGWLDGYTNAIPRLLAHLSVPRLGIIGPWAHMYPHQALPSPGIGFLQEAVRWWDHWLKGRETGIMREPMLRAYIQEAAPALPFYERATGRWAGESEWPLQGNVPETLHLGLAGLTAAPQEPRILEICSPQTTGLSGGEWCPFGTGQGPDFPADQREDDGRSLVFDSAPLPERLEILGHAVVTLTVTADKPTAFVVVRLCDVSPNGASSRVAYGVLNLSHRQGHDRVVPVRPGELYKIEVPLSACGYAFLAGHRIRLAVSTAYWPMIWPTPEPVTLAVSCAGSAVVLPVRRNGSYLAQETLGEPECAAGSPREQIRPSRWERKTERDYVTGATTFTTLRDEGVARLQSNGLEIGTKMVEKLSIDECDPLSARTEMNKTYEIGRGDWKTRLEAQVVLTAGKDMLHLRTAFRAFEADTCVFSRQWTEDIPRDGI